jgi:hypothetical protein
MFNKNKWLGYFLEFSRIFETALIALASENKQI